MLSCSMLSFSACRVFWFRFSCSHFICFMFRVTFHIFTSHVFIFKCRVACFQLSWFSFHFLFIVFLFSCFQFLENRISGNKMTSGSSKITPTWPPGAPKWPESAPRETKRESSRTPKAKVAQIHCGSPIPYNCLYPPAPRPRPRGDYT